MNKEPNKEPSEAQNKAPNEGEARVLSDDELKGIVGGGVPSLITPDWLTQARENLI